MLSINSYTSFFLKAIFLPLLILSLPSHAARGGVDEAGLEAQRKAFEAAEEALRQGNTHRYSKLKQSLKDYPLYPYLEYREIRRNLGAAGNQQVRDFLAGYENTPLASRLLSAWLNHLATHGRWQTYFAFYRPSRSTTRQCHYLQALIHTDQSELAFQQVEPLWLHGKSQPKACDAVFDAWREGEHLTSELVWARIELAMIQRQFRLARYLGRFLTSPDQAWLDLWLKIHRDPQSLLSAKILRQDHPRRNNIILHGVKRLARQRPAEAINVWQQLSGRYPFSLKEQISAERALALALLQTEDADTLSYLERIEPCENDVRLHQTRIRAALSRRNWNTALTWLEALPEPERDKEQWRYWKARVLAELDHQAEAKALFRQVAQGRSYYGFLASERLGLPYKLDNHPVRVDNEELASLLRLPAVKRARELRTLGRMSEARREWEWAARKLNNRQLQVAAKLAQSWNWHDRAIFTLARTGYWDDLELRFPLQYRPRIEQQAESRELDIAWIFAVLRQESAFISDAQSPAGALGLMQLMPSTARTLARSLGRPAPRKVDLLEPALNIRLGAAYLRKVLDAFGQNTVLATAAYNAGPHRVRTWVPTNSLPADIWIETIPFKETRGYLRRVLAYTLIYEQRLGQEPTPLHERMSPINEETLLTMRRVGARVPKS